MLQPTVKAPGPKKRYICKNCITIVISRENMGLAQQFGRPPSKSLREGTAPPKNELNLGELKVKISH